MPTDFLCVEFSFVLVHRETNMQKTNSMQMTENEWKEENRGDHTETDSGKQT